MRGSRRARGGEELDRERVLEGARWRARWKTLDEDELAKEEIGGESSLEKDEDELDGEGSMATSEMRTSAMEGAQWRAR